MKRTEKAIQSKQKLNELGTKEFPHYIPIIFFVVTTIIFFWGQLTGHSFFWEDFVEYVYPIQTFAARESANGSIPFWNPYIFNGMPFIADLQSGFFYPLNRVLNFFVDSNGHLSVWGLQFITIVHFIIAQISFYFLMIYYKRTQLSSIFTSISYAFSGIMVFHVIHPMMIYHLAWLPLILLYFDKGICTRNLKYGIASGLLLGMALLAGHPQTSLYLFFFLFLYFIWIVSIDYFRNKPSFKNILLSKLSAIITFIVAVCIFSIQYLPSRELANEAVRSESSYEKSSEGSMEFKQIISAFIPNSFGKVTPDENNNFSFYLTNGEKPSPYYYYWETSFYFGVPIVILGLFGFIVGISDKRLQILLILAVFGLFYSFGSNFFIHKIFFNLPFFNLFRMPARMMMFVVISFPISAGYGFDFLLKNSNQFKNIVIASIFPILVALLGIIGILGSLINTPSSSLGSLTTISFLSLIFSIVTFIVLYLLNAKKINYINSGIILAIIVFIDLYAAHSGFNSSNKNIADSYTIDKNLIESFKNKDLNNMYRVNTRSYNPPFMATNRNQGMIDAFQNTEGYNPLVLSRVNPALNSSEKIYDLLNVKYELRIDKDRGQAYFFENTDRLPRAWMVYNYRIIPTNKIKEVMPNENINYFKEVILEEDPGITKTITNDSVESKPNVEIVDYKNNYIKLKILNNDKDGILILSEIWYPAWQVTVDGTPSKLYKANYSLRGIIVPKGKSIVELKFRSQQFELGKWIAIFTLIITLPLLLIGNFRKKEKYEE